jgi:hypothetical protein
LRDRWNWFLPNQLLVPIFLTALLLSSSLYAELSKDQVKEIAEQYAEACVNRDFESWKALYFNPEQCTHRDFMRGVADPRLTKPGHLRAVRIRKVKGLTVQVESQKNLGVKTKGWLLLLPNGKIKYDPIIYPHPILSASRECNHALAVTTGLFDQQNDNINYSHSLQYLVESGIPTFGLKIDDSSHNHIKALEEVQEWIEDNWNKWDNSEPHVYYPKK